MARIRTIKPIHWSDKELPRISLQAHLLWIATWNFSDDKGIFEGDVLLLKSQIFPRRTDIRVEQISQWLDQLVKARFIIPFDFGGQGYYISRTFGTHQRIDKPQDSMIPSDFIENLIQENSQNVPRMVLPVEEGNSKSKVNVRDKEGGGDFENSVINSENKKIEPGPQITMPFGEDFFFIWTQWKLYKKAEHRFFYKSPQSEQAAIAELITLAGGKEETASAIIKQSMAKGWKGFFELKNEINGTTTNKNGASKKITGTELDQAFAKRYSQR